MRSTGFQVGRFVVRHFDLCALTVVAVMACNVFLDLGTSKVNDYDEARYGVSAFEMQQHRSFVVTTYAGQKELWALKPPFGYWLMALSFSLFGGSALAMRLPSALCSVAAVAVTLYFMRRRFNRRLAIVAGLVLATTFGYISHHGARSGDMDACLTLILLLIAVGLPAVARSPWRLVPLAGVLACGFLLKSFAIAPMILVGIAYLLWTGDWRRLRPAPSLAATALFLAVVGLWAAARWRADGSADFLLRMFREDVVQRSTSIVDRSTSSPLGYATALFDRFAPWPPVMIAAAALALLSHRRGGTPSQPSGRRRRTLVLLALWIAIPLAFISAVRTQHHWYLDPIYPALAMAAAVGALLLVGRAPARWRTAAFLGLVVLPLALCEARVVARVVLRDPMSADQRFLGSLGTKSGGVCRVVASTFQLAYAERFLLQVTDGFDVVEPGAAIRLPEGACVLSRGTLAAAAGGVGGFGGAVGGGGDGGAVLAANGRYILEWPADPVRRQPAAPGGTFQTPTQGRSPR